MSGVGNGSQTVVAGRLNLPIDSQDVNDDHHYNKYRATVVRESHIFGLMGSQSRAGVHAGIIGRAGDHVVSWR